MKSYLKLSLVLFGMLLMTAHCQEDDAPDDGEGEDPPDGEVDHEEGEVEGEEGDGEGEDMEGEHEGGEDDGAEIHEGDEDEGEGESEEGMEMPAALTLEQMNTLHKKIDVNGNGKVSLAEVTDFAHKMRRELAKSELDEIMKDMDLDKDGKLNWAEFLGDASEIPEEEQNEKQKQFGELDTNKDKSIDHDELAQMYHHHTNEGVETELTNVAMKDKDIDNNGVLSLKEFFQHLQQEGEEPMEIPAEDQEVFKKLDADGSGTLTLKELKAWESGSFQAEEASRKLFAKADKDQDNHVTAEELSQASQEIAEDQDYEPQMYLSQWAEQHAEKGEL